MDGLFETLLQTCGPHPVAKFVSLFSLVPMIKWIILSPVCHYGFRSIEWPIQQMLHFVIIRPSNASPPFVTGFVHHRCVKISRHARQALRIALPPLSLSISFNLSAFSSPSSANQHQRESRGTLEIEDSIISISSRGGKLKWSKIEECDRWRIFDILVYFYNIWLRIRWMDCRIDFDIFQIYCCYSREEIDRWSIQLI